MNWRVLFYAVQCTRTRGFVQVTLSLYKRKRVFSQKNPSLRIMFILGRNRPIPTDLLVENG